MFDSSLNLRSRKVERKIENTTGKIVSKILCKSDSNSDSDFGLKILFDSSNMALNLDHVIKLVPEFDGSSNLLKKFTNTCEIFYSNLVKETDKTLFLQVVTSKLSGRAYEFIKYKNIETYDDLKEELEKQFEDSRSVEQLQLELVRNFQSRNEDVRSFAHRVEETLQALNNACIRREGIESGNVIRSLNESTALRSFQDGLNRSISIIVKACRFDTLKEAIDKAIEEEMSMMKPRHDVFTNFPKTQCQLCFKIGHVATDCFKYTRPSASNSPINKTQIFSPSYKSRLPVPHNLEYSTPRDIKSIRDSGNNLSSIKCLYCKNVGHMLKDCRKRIYNNQKRESQNLSIDRSKTSNVHVVAENSEELGQTNKNTVVRVQDI